MIAHYKNIELEDIIGEIWKPIFEYESYYMVSNYGRIKSLDRHVWSDYFNRYNVRAGRIIKQCLSNKGYLKCVLQVDKIKLYTSVHRLVLKSFNKIENSGLFQINHINGIKTDNRVENLEWCTSKENINHAINIGLKKSLIGVDNIKNKLSEMDVQNIRNEFMYYHKMKSNANELAKKYKVSKRAIFKIIYGITWVKAA